MDQRQFEATLSDAEIRLRRLRTLYDQWFHGLERSEPQVQRAEIDRMIGDMRRAQPRNTALRFRFNQLVQRYTSYNTYWQRITRQIEEGTYKRDVLRARKRYGERDTAKEGRHAKDGYELDLDIDIEAALDSAIKSEPPPPSSEAPPPRSSRPPPNSDRPPRAMREITPFALPSSALGPGLSGVNGNAGPLLPAIGGTAPALRGGASIAAKMGAPSKGIVTPKVHAAPVVSMTPKAGAPNASMPPVMSRKPPPIPAGASRRPPAAASAAPSRAPAATGLSDDQIQGIYARYVEARKQNKERVDNVKIETVAKTVRDMLPKLEQKHAGKKIDFEVVVKDGRVALKPVAK